MGICASWTSPWSQAHFRSYTLHPMNWTWTGVYNVCITWYIVFCSEWENNRRGGPWAREAGGQTYVGLAVAAVGHGWTTAAGGTSVTDASRHRWAGDRAWWPVGHRGLLKWLQCIISRKAHQGVEGVVEYYPYMINSNPTELMLYSKHEVSDCSWLKLHHNGADIFSYPPLTYSQLPENAVGLILKTFMVDAVTALYDSSLRRLSWQKDSLIMFICSCLFLSIKSQQLAEMSLTTPIEHFHFFVALGA